MSYSRLEENSHSVYSSSRNHENYESISIANDHCKNKSFSNVFKITIVGSSPEEVYEAIGYKKSLILSILFYLIIFLTGGLAYLVAYWRPDWRLQYTKKKCHISQADELILTDLDGTNFVVKVEFEDYYGDIPQEYNILNDNTTAKRSMRYFVFQYLKYIWNREKSVFECFIGLANNNTTVSSLLSEYRGYNSVQQHVRLKLYGENCISTEVKSYPKLFFTEILHPFYIFQIFSLALWGADGYVLYAVCIFIITSISIGFALFETRQQSENLKNMVEASNANTVMVLRDPGALNPVEENALYVVPGDVIVIPSTGGVMACDAVLISGNAIVNESMLTGESVPVTKTPLTLSEDGEIYSPETHKRHTLFCGTNVIQTRYYGKEQVLAVVVRTAFSTAKGELVRSILYPRSIVFKFYDASMKFVQFMFIISSLGMAYSLYLHITRHKPVADTIFRTLDIVTIVVPPALPAAMTVGTYYAQSRLKKMGIYCISPPRINVCGKLKLVCFDKTGTLTEDGLNVWGVVGVEKDLAKGSLHLGTPCHQVDRLDLDSTLIAALASCHSLTYINGQLTGDPLDIQMFEATKWDLVEPEKETENFDCLVPTLVRPPRKILLSPHEEQSAAIINSRRRERESTPLRMSKDGGCDVVEGNKPLPRSYTKITSDDSNADVTVTINNSNADVTVTSDDSNAVITVTSNNSNADVTVTSNNSNADVTVTSDDSNADITVLLSSIEMKTDSISKGDECRPKFTSSLTIEQILTELSNDYGGVASTVIKSYVCETYVDTPSFVNVAETAFKVPYEIGIVRQFPFSSSAQRMSVIVRVLGRSHMELFCKGAPEVIQHLCNPDTVPANFSSVLTQFTVKGFRVIALAHRNLDHKLSWHTAQRIKRNKVECDLTFLGLLILQNVLKPETTPVISLLKSANIRTVMITGDNILTGICVARDCGMVDKDEVVLLANVVKDDSEELGLVLETTHSGGLEDTLESSQDKMHINIEGEDSYHLAVTGQAWSQIKEHFPEYLPYIVSKGTIFARMSPEQKVQVVEELQALNYVVGMCGDGANDCGALKAAHVGISLSEAEASVAAPFTSRVPNITCVPKVICEGRGALTTNFSTFKYMALYSIIQFVSVLLLYTACTNLSDPQFLYIDLFIVTSIAIFMGYTKAEHKLVPQRPLSNLIGYVNIFSIMIQILLVIVFQIFAYWYLLMQPWYYTSNNCINPDSDNITNTWETTVIFCVSSIQYISLSIIYSPGHPFRKPLYTNIWLIMTIVVLLTFTLWMLLYPYPFLEMLLQLSPFPGDPQFMFRGGLLLIAGLHFAMGWSVEYFIAGSTTLKKIFQFLTCKKEPKNLYKRVQIQMMQDPSWPPIDAPIRKAITSTS